MPELDLAALQVELEKVIDELEAERSKKLDKLAQQVCLPQYSMLRLYKVVLNLREKRGSNA